MIEVSRASCVIAAVSVRFCLYGLHCGGKLLHLR